MNTTSKYLASFLVLSLVPLSSFAAGSTSACYRSASAGQDDVVRGLTTIQTVDLTPASDPMHGKHPALTFIQTSCLAIPGGDSRIVVYPADYYDQKMLGSYFQFYVLSSADYWTGAFPLQSIKFPNNDITYQDNALGGVKSQWSQNGSCLNYLNGAVVPPIPSTAAGKPLWPHTVKLIVDIKPLGFSAVSGRWGYVLDCRKPEVKAQW